MNALALPPALRFNAAVAPDAILRFGAAIGAPNDPAARVEELARLGGFERLSQFDVPAADLRDLATLAAQRPGNASNPRPATSDEIEELLRSIW
jgi:alcohol dehydrogenase class IV